MEAHVFFLKLQKPFTAFAREHGLANVVKVLTQLSVQLATEHKNECNNSSDNS